MTVKITVEASDPRELATTILNIAGMADQPVGDEIGNSVLIGKVGGALESQIIELRNRVDVLEDEQSAQCDHKPLELYWDEERTNPAHLFQTTMYEPRNIFKSEGPFRTIVTGDLCQFCNQLFWIINREELSEEKGDEEASQ